MYRFSAGDGWDVDIGIKRGKSFETVDFPLIKFCEKIRRDLFHEKRDEYVLGALVIA